MNGGLIFLIIFIVLVIIICIIAYIRYRKYKSDLSIKEKLIRDIENRKYEKLNSDFTEDEKNFYYSKSLEELKKINKEEEEEH